LDSNNQLLKLDIQRCNPGHLVRHFHENVSPSMFDNTRLTPWLLLMLLPLPLLDLLLRYEAHSSDKSKYLSHALDRCESLSMSLATSATKS
jgi:hypothetical protein